MPFYRYSQNNSGGKFHENDKLCCTVIIEADSFDEANLKAESIGIYFNGVENGLDCECCGDRWWPPDEIIFPYQWDSTTRLDNITQYIDNCFRYTIPWMRIDTRIFYKNGEVQEIVHPKWKYL